MSDVCIRCNTQEYVENGNFVPAGRMRDKGRWRDKQLMSVMWGINPKRLGTAVLEDVDNAHGRT